VVAGDQLRLAFGQVKGRPIGLRRGRNGIHHKTGQAPGREDEPVRFAP
jgi:peptidyl-tRNA hydrolase